MKRKLNKAAEVQKRKAEQAQNEDEETFPRPGRKEEEDSEEDSESSDDEAQVEQAVSEEDEEEEESLERKKKRVKGALSSKDAEIMRVRHAEQSRIESIVPYRNKQRVLIFCSRGVTSRFRHLMEDMRMLLPHHRKEVKHDTKRNLSDINDLCEMKQCNNCLFFEARKSKDLYMWLSKTPNGPSIKFHVLNIHTMDELRLSGNCLKGSRPYLSFAKEFEETPTLQLIKEMFTQIFGTPNGHPKSKPFHDHIMTFTIMDGKIWFRHYQIVDTTQDPVEIRRALKRGDETIKLVEIGPRFVLDLIKVFEGSFHGQTIVENPDYVTPNSVRSAIMKGKSNAYVARKKSQKARDKRLETNVIPKDPVRSVFRE